MGQFVSILLLLPSPSLHRPFPSAPSSPFKGSVAYPTVSPAPKDKFLVPSRRDKLAKSDDSRYDTMMLCPAPESQVFPTKDQAEYENLSRMGSLSNLGGQTAPKTPTQSPGTPKDKFLLPSKLRVLADSDDTRYDTMKISPAKNKEVFPNKGPAEYENLAALSKAGKSNDVSKPSVGGEAATRKPTEKISGLSGLSDIYGPKKNKNEEPSSESLSWLGPTPEPKKPEEHDHDSQVIKK